MLELLDPASRRRLLLGAMRARLYNSFYTPGGVVPVDASGSDGSHIPDPILVAALAAANSGSGSWEMGWTLVEARGGDQFISREGITVRARWNQCRIEDGAAELSVARASELPALSPGFLTLVGDVNLDPRSDDMIGRLYLNISPTGAPGLVTEITSLLNRAGVPFRLKVANNSAGFRRCDAAVLYLPAADVRRRRSLLRRAIAGCGDDLRPGTPVFTKRLAPGVGFAEEQGAATESFGMRRCRVLAEGILVAHEKGARDLDRRVQIVERHFSDSGVELKSPYLEPGSADAYSL